MIQQWIKGRYIVCWILHHRFTVIVIWTFIGVDVKLIQWYPISKYTVVNISFGIPLQKFWNAVLTKWELVCSSKLLDGTLCTGKWVAWTMCTLCPGAGWGRTKWGSCWDMPSTEPTSQASGCPGWAQNYPLSHMKWHDDDDGGGGDDVNLCYLRCGWCWGGVWPSSAVPLCCTACMRPSMATPQQRGQCPVCSSTEACLVSGGGLAHLCLL